MTLNIRESPREEQTSRLLPNYEENHDYGQLLEGKTRSDDLIAPTTTREKMTNCLIMLRPIPMGIIDEQLVPG
jgi:hypothetical protein